LKNVVDDNWIETEARAPNRTAWTIIRAGRSIHSEEQTGDDSSGAKAFEAGLQWATRHFPGVAFHWRHRSLAAAAARPGDAGPWDQRRSAARHDRDE
jgi:hypothetical protein